MAADNFSKSVAVFDADTGAVLATIPLPTSGFAVGDTLTLPDQSLGFVTDFANQVFVIDLRASPPRLANLNPIVISNPGEDLSLSPDGRFLVITNGGTFTPISVVDIAARVEVSTFDTGRPNDSVATCTDGSVLVTSFGEGIVTRLLLDPNGGLVDTGERLFVELPLNVLCAPDGRTGVVLADRFFDASVDAFSVEGLQPLSSVARGATSSFSSAFRPDGRQVYLRGNDFANGGATLDAFDYDPLSGTIGALRQSRRIDPGSSFFGIDQVAVHPDASKVYVTQPSRIDVLDAQTLELVFSIALPGFIEPSGVSLPTAKPATARNVVLDIKPESEVAPINLGSNGVIPVAVLGSLELDVRQVDAASLRFARGAVEPSQGIGSEDVNGDGLTDLVVRFRTRRSGIAAGDTEACVSGRLLDGTPISGCDAIRVVPGTR